MKILDRYIAKNFIIGYLIALTVLIGLCIVIDLFVNLDEFAEHSDLGTMAVVRNIFNYYAVQSTMYFRDFAGMITVIAAVFSLGKMTRSNEFVAVMASGVSLKRVIAPIIALAVLLTAFSVADQELLIPISPFIIVRKETAPAEWKVVGRITAEKAVFNPQTKNWLLTNGSFLKIISADAPAERIQKPVPVAFFATDITPGQIPIRRQEGYKSLLSSVQLAELARQKGTRDKDLAELFMHRHLRITDPLMNLVMLLLALPVLVCRDPKDMKSAIMTSFLLTAGCYIITFISKMFATEVFFGQVRPELWAWAPVFIFLPAAFIVLDSMRT
ncbi:MAG: LptF/LptG family permease [Planctomycetota bacterium]|nr:LptF/LptG family permease [Planctomycetota bacterium]